MAAALQAFDVRPEGWVCVDLGSHAGGFVDCLLRHGARRVYAVEPGRGVLDLKLREDARVVVQERCNALHWECPEQAELVTIDVGWTAQRLVLPAARRCLSPTGRCITLVKPHYESPRDWLRRGVLRADRVDDVLESVRADVADVGWKLIAECASPLLGHGGNAEFLWLLSPA